MKLPFGRKNEPDDPGDQPQESPGDLFTPGATPGSPGSESTASSSPGLPPEPGSAPASPGPPPGPGTESTPEPEDAGRRFQLSGLVRRDLPVGWLVGNRFALVGLVVVALVALYGVAHFSTPKASGAEVEKAKPERAAVVSALTVCPGAEMGDGSSTRFGLVNPESGKGNGAARVTRTGGDHSQAGALRQMGTGWFGEVTDPPDPLIVTGAGTLAAGLTGGQVSSGKVGKDGLTGTHCTRPATDSWFVGPGPQDDDVRLHLANPDDGPATVSIDVYSDGGELDTSDAGAIFVPPHGTEDVSLTDRAATAHQAALHVRTSMGRVSAAIQATGKNDDGADWVPAGSGPSRRLTVPGVPGGSGGRDLLVAAPGTRDATVKVSAITEDGTVTPGGEGQLQVPAGAVVPLELDGTLSGKAAALTLTSDVPVVAGLQAQRDVDGGKDTAYTASASPLDGRGVAAVNRSGDGYTSSVVLSAVGGDVTARVGTTGPKGTNPGKPVRIRSGHTTEVTPDAPSGSGDGYGIVVTVQPGPGRLYAARVLTHKVGGGEQLTVDPLESAAGTVPVYPSNDSLDAVVR